MALAITGAIAETKASSIKDMGKVVGALKGKYAGRMDITSAPVIRKAWRISLTACPFEHFY